ncbi:tetratricopeptide repeat protein [Ovoidimarina sediminis]|uniref:tetratricopeptide repeat protein n=1 Tax=Ovoidimarina sediminis TaxID=3079856 RepID=UPI002907DD68|nr:tetratricopeptide repeat protein [Rhodophyticola sp. MJ-SS7]MDU8943671.1 tetratricopeptide repeat protein [Rhodophyticola sp. MJ-SS7]
MQKALTRLFLTAALAASPVLAAADINAGAYLAARQAGFGSDFAAAADYYSRALVTDSSNPALVEAAMTSYLSLGDLDRAIPLARRLVETETENQIANLVLMADRTEQGDWPGILDALEGEASVGPLYDGLMRAWALLGEGRMGDALEAFDAVSEGRGTQAFGLYHRALALASVGDFEGADAVFSGENGPRLRLTRRGVLAHAQVLSQLDRAEDAASLIDQVFGPDLDPYLATLKEEILGGSPVAFDVVTSPVDGVAELHYSIAGAITGEASDAYTLIYARIAERLKPTHIDALLLSAELLERLGRYELATAVYDKVPRDHPYFHAAELGRANALRASGREDAAIEVLTQLGKSHGHLPAVHVSLGDLLRGLERYDEASKAYDRAIALVDDPQASHWSLFFSRGITHEREGRWDQAEADFRKALELQPEQPQVLNYLGYSFVEMQTNMDEALDMIERAVAGRPNSGYITDSLGWALYRLGRYDEAVGHMERAVELLPIDPIINDHLGDVYWAVGRTREAEFQWQRALSFDPEPEEADRIRRKLEVGLDIVLEEEGSPPLKVANDEG